MLNYLLVWKIAWGRSNIVTRLQWALSAATAGLLISCAPAQTEQPVNAPESSLKELYYPSGNVLSKLPPVERPSTFCMKNIVESDAQLSGTSEVTGLSNALTGAAGRPCDIEVSYFRDDFEPTVTHAQCEWEIDLGASPRVTRMNITSETGSEIEECFLRLAMANAGYPGALKMPGEILFVPREQTIWNGYSNFPRRVPKVPHMFIVCGIEPPQRTKEFDIPEEIYC